MKLKSVFAPFLFFFLTTGVGFAQNIPMDTLGIKYGSIHMKGSFPYTKFFKKYKGTSDLTLQIWYNTTDAVVKDKSKPGADEVYFLYGRNRSKGRSEMEFQLGDAALKTFSKKKDKELQEFIDFLEFDVFPKQNFNGIMAMEALKEEIATYKK